MSSQQVNNNLQKPDTSPALKLSTIAERAGQDLVDFYHSGRHIDLRASANSSGLIVSPQRDQLVQA